MPDAKDELIRHYTFNETDLSIIQQHRGPANRLGFAVMLCYLRFPGIILGTDESPSPPLLRLVAAQLKVPTGIWDKYGQREQTRREHLVELRRRVHAGLNKGEARNALARAVFFYRLGEIRDRSFEQQRYRASGLNLVTAAIVLWNTVYLEHATNALRRHGQLVDNSHLQYLSPLGWEHINLTGDYLWRSSAKIGTGKFRPLRQMPPA